MGTYLDIAKEWEKKNPRPYSIDGHQVKEVILETAHMVIFRDPDRRLWRRVHSWRMIWPVEIKER